MRAELTLILSRDIALMLARNPALDSFPDELEKLTAPFLVWYRPIAQA